MNPAYPYEVKITEQKSPHGLSDMVRTYELLDWMSNARYFADRDFQIDMHGGIKGYTSFWFKDRDKALLVKLRWG